MHSYPVTQQFHSYTYSTLIYIYPKCMHMCTKRHVLCTCTCTACMYSMLYMYINIIQTKTTQMSISYRMDNEIPTK